VRWHSDIAFRETNPTNTNIHSFVCCHCLQALDSACSCSGLDML